MLGGLAFAASCLAYFWLSYKSGCTADLKGGTWGDFDRALQYDGLSVFPGLLALVIGTAAPFLLLRRRTLLVRGVLAVVCFLGVGGALLAGGINIAFNATHECGAQWRGCERPGG